ncbi:hypothetical protein PHLCEN_2v12982 [Hermanssonia centrifuga]|uniref:Uncharacterized protein n=1 Tax=Hermanssonia centrifuga TaxID=98765 RepID=A0A2R6NFL2_9APHY|nr:hypothetical protein PHLCEN_2v12982 [Hermanssonia centrifuga]
MPFLQQIPSPEYQAPNQPFERTPTTYFRYDGAPAVGISLHDAFCNNLIGLEKANEPVFGESGAKISYRIMWSHYAPFSKQKYATRTRNGACLPITRAKAARQIAQVVKEFIDKVIPTIIAGYVVTYYRTEGFSRRQRQYMACGARLD